VAVFATARSCPNRAALASRNCHALGARGDVLYFFFIVPLAGGRTLAAGFPHTVLLGLIRRPDLAPKDNELADL